jgi:hypothetical protein
MSALLEREENYTTRPKGKARYFGEHHASDVAFTAAEQMGLLMVEPAPSRKRVTWGPEGSGIVIAESDLMATHFEPHVPRVEDADLVAWVEAARAEVARDLQAIYPTMDTRNRRNFLVRAAATGRIIPSAMFAGSTELMSLDLKTLSESILAATALFLHSKPGHGDDWERPISELIELKDGWNGPESIAPTSKTKEEVQLVIGLIRFNQRLPEFVVDDSDGVVSLTWARAGDPAFLSLIFRGDGRVTIVGRSSERDHVISDTIDIGNEARILAPFSSQQLSHLTSRD